MQESVFIVPRPPSVNACFGNRPAGQKGRGRYITPEYARWRTMAGNAILARGKIPRFATEVEIEIRATDPDNGRTMDGDNLLKGILDLLVSLGIILDDSRKIVRKCSVAWVEDGKADSIAVFIRQTTETRPSPKYARKDQRGKDWAIKHLKRKFGIEISPDRIHMQ